MDLEKEQNLFRANLFRFQEAREYSEVKLSQELGKSNSYIQSISSCKNMPRFNTFIAICDVLKRDPIEFFMNSENTELLADTLRIGELLDETGKQKLRDFAKELAETHSTQNSEDSERQDSAGKKENKK